jgi:hypothetical protein
MAKWAKLFWYKHVLNALPENQEAPALYKGSTFHEIVEESAKRQQEGQIDEGDSEQEFGATPEVWTYKYCQ